MPRYREPFTLYRRVMLSGKGIYYFQTYDGNGKRTVARSTGQTSKAAAYNWCRKRHEDGTLATGGAFWGPPSLEAYSDKWFIWEKDKDPKCQYIKLRLKRGVRFSRRTADDYRSMLDRLILPKLGQYRLNEITPKVIEEWRETLDLSPRSINIATKVMRIIVREAIRLGEIDIDPFTKIQPLAENKDARGIPTREEAKKILNALKEDEVVHRAHVTLAETGLRAGELLALRWEDIHDDHLVVTGSYSAQYGRGPTKTGTNRVVAISPQTRKELGQRGFGYVFSYDGRKPVTHGHLRRSLQRACTSVGIDWKKRKISTHSWRHYATSRLQEAGVPDALIRGQLGHKTTEMTTHYGHADVLQSAELAAALEELT